MEKIKKGKWLYLIVHRFKKKKTQESQVYKRRADKWTTEELKIVGDFFMCLLFTMR